MEGRCTGGEGGLNSGEYYDACGTASRLRRRCRSEGLERSPYDAVQPPAYLYSLADGIIHRGNQNQTTSNKSPLSLNGMEREHYVHITSFPPLNGLNDLNGEHVMANQSPRSIRYSPTRSPKIRTISPNKSFLRSQPRQNSPLSRDERLPKVEELLEKVEHPDLADYNMEPVKQPLKSILNNPRKSPPPGILKKKCKSQDSRQGGEGRRRPRAHSESDYNYGNCYEMHRSVHESRLQNALSNMKRMKDNSGTIYYGNSVYDQCPKRHTSPKRQGSPKQHESPKAPGSPKRQRSPKRQGSPQPQASPKPHGILKGHPVQVAHCHDWPLNGVLRLQEGNLLRTTSIGVQDESDIVLPQPSVEIPGPSPSAEAPNAVAVGVPVVTPRTLLKKVARTGRKGKGKSRSKVPMRSKKTEEDPDVDNASELASPPPSPSVGWSMEMDPEPPEESEQDLLRHLTDKMTNAVVSPNKNCREASSTIPDGLSSCIRPSLFPRVPPYLKFIDHDASPALRPPFALAKHLRWKLTSITPIVVKKTLINSGFRLVKSECDTSECPQDETVDWIGIWGKHMKSLLFRGIKDGQKMNHFPGTFQIGRKDRLWRNLQKLVARHGVKEFGIMPKTFVLPHDMKILKREWEIHSCRNEKWIIKPPASARGTGIVVVSRWSEIPKKRSVVVQRYISKPYLINGSKFDLRLYVLVTSVHPLKIYLFKDGLARFASVKYTEEVASLHDRYIHLTNYSINRLSKNYTQNEDASACQGHKWTLQTLLQYLGRERGVNTNALWESMKELVIKTIVCGEGSIRSLTEANVTSRYNCYELFGIDVLLDEELKPWLLEVNISPSLHSSSPLDLHVKGPLVSAVLNIAQFHVPGKVNLDHLSKDRNGSKYIGVAYDPRLYTVYLSKEERDKHIIYTKMEDRDEYLSDILSTLTPDDVRHLLQAEDELEGSGGGQGGMERIFPTDDTHKYLDFLPSPRYYNRLLDAWECKYKHDRTPGINLLRSLCELGYHLEVPPVPLKSDEEEAPARAEYASLSLEVVARPAGGGGSGCELECGPCYRECGGVALPARA